MTSRFLVREALGGGQVPGIVLPTPTPTPTPAPSPTPTPTAGTSASRYSFAGTRFRLPTNVRAVSGSNTSLIGQFVTASPDYATTNWAAVMPAFYQTPNGGSSPETAAPNTITIEGFSLSIDGGATWTAAPAAGFPVAIDPSNVAGALLPAVPITIPANTQVRGRVAYNVPSGGSLPTNARNVAAGEAIQGGTASLAAKLTDGTALTNVNGHADAYQPAFMVAQGGDGRPAVLIFGDSIGFGANDSSDFSATVSNWSARHAFGYLARGLDDAATSKRIAHANLCIPGSRPLDITARDSNFSRRKLDLVKLVNTAFGAWPFDEIVHQHGTNSVSGTTSGPDLVAGMRATINALKADSGKPVTQVEMLAKAGSSDGYASLGNQTVTAQDSYNGGAPATGNARWWLNAAIGVNGTPDAGTTLRADGTIQDSFAPWRQGSYDTDTNRDRLRVLAFSTTLTAAAAQNAVSFSMAQAPSVGECLNIVTASGFADGHVLTVTGSGPYTVGMVMTSQVPSGGAASGAKVQAQMHALDGTHPGTPAHRDVYAGAVVGWKQRRGWA